MGKFSRDGFVGTGLASQFIQSDEYQTKPALLRSNSFKVIDIKQNPPSSAQIQTKI